MQPHQYALAAGIALLFTLATLPFLFALARRRAFSRGKAIGLEIRDITHAQQVRTLNDELDDLEVQREAEQRKHHTTVANLKRTITELEERIMSYTGLAVTRTDYEQILAAAETLRLTERTLTAMKATTQGVRAGQQASNLDELAKRVHTQLRATAMRAEVAA
ncbi:hypothetical protein [Pseudomonas monteilii]|uniref:hypothetical protein n=1 Tax=Pseudomonas monteilii TaxID=76759 RepID=UPI00048D0332|nr:hypothetical protein [Pseudomonas monteilii]KPM60213.1 hypothetical protein HB4184_22150 [Pseudomonas putida]MBA6089206.1 hypothetical protein [Pseudomonas monteilii]